MTNTTTTAKITDVYDDVVQLNEAMQSLTDLMAGCNETDAPPITYLWRLVAILTQYCDKIEGDLAEVIS